MDTRRFLIGTVVGGVVLFGIGYLAYSVVLGNFYTENVGTATGIMRDPPIIWAIALGSLLQAAFLTAVIGWAGASSAGTGFRVAGTVGFLVIAAIDFIMYGTTNISNLTATIVDPLVAFVHSGIGGAVIAVVAGRRPAAA